MTRAWFIDYSTAQLGNWHTKMSKWQQFVWSTNCADSLTGENAGCWTTNAEYSTSGCPSRWSRHFRHLPTCGKVQRSCCSVTNSLLRIVCYLEPMQCARYEVYQSPELQWMHMEEHPPKSAAYGSGRMGTPVITLTEWVEPSSFAAVGDRLLEQFFSVMHALDPIRSRQKDQTKPFWLSKYYWRTLNFWSVNFAVECNISFSSVACERTLLATSSFWLDHSFDIVWNRLVVGSLGQTSDQPADLHFGALTLSTGCTTWNGKASHLRFVLKGECNQENLMRGKSCWTIVHVRTSDWSHAASS